jgi:aspartyl/asparaginyl-tRNA synthetase
LATYSGELPVQDIYSYNFLVKQLRHFFQDLKGYIEVPAQCRLSILAACEDPSTITKFNFDKINYPLPQTGQMWLEKEILNNPSVPGVFCVTTSYRNEPFPIPGRHEKVFPMFEFESHGGMAELKKIESELVQFLGFDAPTVCLYSDMSKKYGVAEIKAEQELYMQADFGDSLSLEYFPQYTHPFWNMKHAGNGIFNKADIILQGMETIGSAERATDIDEMRDNFYTLSNGLYSQLLFDQFSKERVEQELEEYFSMTMFPRFGAGIGVTRLHRAMQLSNLIPETAIAV